MKIYISPEAQRIYIVHYISLDFINLLQTHLALQVRKVILFSLSWLIVFLNGPSTVKDTLISSKIILEMSYYVRNAIICLSSLSQDRAQWLKIVLQPCENLKGKEIERVT